MTGLPSASWIRVVVVLAATVWLGVLGLSGERLDPGWLRPLGFVATIVVILVLLFDRWLWCKGPLRQVPTLPPLLRGTWRIELRTNHPDRSHEIIEAYMIIRQTCSSISVSMVFDRSHSLSRIASLKDSGSGWLLTYTFGSTKAATEPASNPSSRGAAEIRISRQPRVHFEGDYWTDVGTKGHD